jgi:hypothetical protein
MRRAHSPRRLTVPSSQEEVQLRCLAGLNAAFVQYDFDGKFVAILDRSQDRLEWRETPPPTGTPLPAGSQQRGTWRVTATHSTESGRQTIRLKLDDVCPNVQSGFFMVFSGDKGIASVDKSQIELRALGRSDELPLPFMLPSQLGGSTADAAVISWMYRDAGGSWHFEKVGLPTHGSVGQCDAAANATQVGGANLW